jgi:uncharacterized DUF497 family protein
VSWKCGSLLSQERVSKQSFGRVPVKPDGTLGGLSTPMRGKRVERQPIEFEWDDLKRAINLRKHGIDLEDCPKVFSDPHAFRYRSAIGEPERRFVIVGRLGEKTVAVVYTPRGEVVRIISARIARREERERYADRAHR